MHRLSALTALSVLIALPATADTVTGRVLSYDPEDFVLVLEDKSVWKLNNPSLVLPDDLAAGATVTIDCQSAGDEGFVRARKVTIKGS